MLRILFAIIGYVSTATVIAALLGLAMLWQSGQLGDEKMFRTVALWHGVDLAEVAAKQKQQQEGTNEVPDGEPSPAENDRVSHVSDRNYEVKMLALVSGRREFDYMRRKLDEKSSRIDRQVQEWQAKLEDRLELASQQSIGNVVNNLQIAPPEVAKSDLMQMMDEGLQQDVIKLWIAMPKNTRKKILETIETPEELDRLHEMHLLMLKGYPDRPEVEAAIRELEEVESSDI
jgi:hypothetical protein